MKQKLLNLKTKSTTLKAISTLALFFLVNLSYSQIYVDNTASGAEDGSSWINAYTSIKTAVSNATDGDEIHIATGVYTEGSTIYFSNKALLIKGGYNTNTNIQDDRSTLDGENTYHLLELYGVGSDALFENLNIINGNKVWNGGGVYINNSSPTFNNITFSDNYTEKSGGAIYSINSFPIFTNTTFTGNRSDIYGGAIYAYSGTITISNATFENNTSENQGGGLGINSEVTAVTINNSIFNSNSSSGAGGAIGNRGDNLIIKNTSFIENNSGNYGGAISNNDSPATTIINTVFYNNIGGSSGSIIYNNDSSSTLKNCSLFGDGTTNPTIYNPSGDITINNTVFYNNGSDITGPGNIFPSYIASDNASYEVSISIGFIDLNTGTTTAADIFSDINDPDGPDDVWNTVDDGLSLVSGSLLLDSGNNSVNTETKDITGQTDRVLNTTIDIGAYEFDSTLLSISEASLNTEFLLYPNPASDIINIRATQPITKIELFDVSGKSVLKTTHTSKININSLQPGLYLLNIVSENTQIVKKIIIK